MLEIKPVDESIQDKHFLLLFQIYKNSLFGIIKKTFPNSNLSFQPRERKYYSRFLSKIV